ncbi:MAG: serine aminopeptidase domain-containing protein [Polyangia bacterium]
MASLNPSRAQTSTASTPDPLVYQKPAAAHTAREVLAAVARIEQHLADVKVPLLALHGTGDKVTPPAGTEALYQHAGATDKTLKLSPGLYHDLVHEPEKETVLTDIVTWIGARVGG